MMMQAILAIVQSQDAEVVLERLKMLNLPCLERIASSGSFLRESNTSLWMAVPPEQVNRVLSVLRDTCQRRTSYTPSYYIETAPMIFAFPLEVEVGGATAFICDLEHYEVF
jgi:uncharacterized protein YaaQ